MNLDELQSVQARERQSSDLQHLRSSFYREVGEFINELNEERARVVEAAEDPFSEPDVRRLTDDIETAESTVEAIYERRVGKVVKKASIAAAGMPIDDDGLTAEEEALFSDLVDRIESNRETVLSVLDGEAPTVSCTIDEAASETDRDGVGANPDGTAPPVEPDADSAPDPGSTAGDAVSAADLMGNGSGTADQSTQPDAVAKEPGAEPTPPEAGRPTEPAETAPETAESDVSTSDPRQRSGGDTGRDVDSITEKPSEGAPNTPSERDGRDEDRIPGIPRTTVRITADIGEIVGADDRDYDLGSEDVVTLPSPNADVLVEKDAAERLQ